MCFARSGPAIALAALLLGLPACSGGAPEPNADAPVAPTPATNQPAPNEEDRPMKTTPTPTEAPASIGSARMEADGTLVLTLRAEDGAGAVGDAQFRYPKDHPQYAEVLKHIGGLEPGQEKPVPPWD